MNAIMKLAIALQAGGWVDHENGDALCWRQEETGRWAGVDLANTFSIDVYEGEDDSNCIKSLDVVFLTLANLITELGC